MLAADDVRFLAVLVQRGHVEKSTAEAILAASRSERGRSATLEDLLVCEAGFERERVRLLRRTEGHEPPAVPGYEVLGLAGVGGTAVVYHAREAASGRDVALKVLHHELKSNRAQVRRFIDEAKLLIALEHENIVKGYRIGKVHDRRGRERLVFIMEWIPGRSLLTLLREGKSFTEDLALYIVLQAAKALRSMHEHGVLHRDVKPDNILLTDDHVVKLIDLGFATSMGGGGGERDAEGEGTTTVGTAAYMSPEQAQGSGDLDVRSDIYSLGATLYQLVVGDLPFRGEGTQEQLAARILDELSSPQLQSRRISPHMNYFIRKMMERDRDFRYGSIDELVEDIEQQIRGKKTLDFGGASAVEGAELLDRSLGVGPPPQEPGRIPPRRKRP